MRAQPRKPSWPFTINSGSPQSRGLVAWWPSEPNGGKTLFDQTSGGRSHGLLPNPHWSFGLDGGKCPRFDGTLLEHCSLRASAHWPLGTTSRTVCCWFKMTTNQDAQLISYGGNGADGTRFGIFYSSGLVGMGGEFINSLGYFSWTYNANWNHIAIVLTGTTANTLLIYYNGVRQSETYINGANTLNTLSTDPVFGCLSGSNSSSLYIGLIDDARIYNYALSASAIAALYNAPTRWKLRWQPSQTARLFNVGNPIQQSSRFRNIIIDQAVKSASTY